MKPRWPPAFDGVETPDWLYTPREQYPPFEMERKRAEEDEEENS